MLVNNLQDDTPFGGNTVAYESVKRFALRGLNDLIRVLMENVDDSLFELSDKVGNDRERNMYFEAMREVRLKREGIQKNFDYEMQECFNRFVQNRSAKLELDDTEELTLVEFDDLEDSIAIDNMISKARPHFEDDLFAVEERLKVIFQRKKIEQDKNPLDPKAICDSFHNASELLDTDIQVKLIFYKLFDKYVLNHLGHFYRELNQFFIKKGVLPDFKVSQERMRQTTSFMANRIKNAEAQQVAGSTVASLAGAPSNSARQTPGGNLLTMLQQAVSPGSAALPGAAGVASYGAAQAGGEGLFEPGGGVVPGAQINSYISALTSLQTANAPAIPAQPLEAVDLQNFKAAAQQQLVAFKQQNAHQTSAADNQIIDVVSMLFDFFFDDDTLPDPIKVLIGRLQIPILKVATIDKNFFNHKKHPARKLLDGISRASLGWADDGKQEKVLIDKIEEIINYLLTEFEENIEVFEKALHDLEQFLGKEDEKIERVVEETRKQEQQKDQQIKDAQNAASALVQKLISKRELSFEVTDFLETVWTSVLFNTYLTLGPSSNHWKNLRRISSTFVWTLVPNFTEEERKKILQTIPALLRALSRGMELVRISTEVQNRIYQMLAQEHAKIVKQTSKNIVTRIDDKTVWPEDSAAAAFSEILQIDKEENPDFEFGTDGAGEIQLIENEVDADSITLISESPTLDVIKNLNDFTTSVKKGEIKVDEEIVMDSFGTTTLHSVEKLDEDDFLEQSRAMEIGAWVEFSESDSKVLVARLSWKSNVTGKYVFVNRQGHKVRNMTTNGFANELRARRAKCIESSSVYDRAIFTIMSKLKH